MSRVGDAGNLNHGGDVDDEPLTALPHGRNQALDESERAPEIRLEDFPGFETNFWSPLALIQRDRKNKRLNCSHRKNSYAGLCLKQTTYKSQERPREKYYVY